MKNVQINHNWIQTLHIKTDNDDCEDNNSFDSKPQSDNEVDNPSDSLIHEYTDSRCIHNMVEKIIEIAPVEDYYPIGIFKDKYAKEMNFPTLFF